MGQSGSRKHPFYIELERTELIMSYRLDVDRGFEQVRPRTMGGEPRRWRFLRTQSVDRAIGRVPADY